LLVLDALLFKHLGVLFVELIIVDTVEHLLGGFSIPGCRQQLFDDIDFRLLDYTLPFLELHAELVLLRSGDHAFLLCLLAEGSVRVFIFPVRILPELADERLALLLVSGLLPMRNDFLL